METAMENGSKASFEGWAVLELMGHRRLGGFVTAVELAGAGMLRIDVPGEQGNVATQFYSPSALYCLTPCSEVAARAVAAHNRPEPVSRWELPTEAMAGRIADHRVDDDDEEEEADEDIEVWASKEPMPADHGLLRAPEAAATEGQRAAREWGLPEIFGQCCHRGPARFDIQMPFRQRDYVYATDGRILLRQPVREPEPVSNGQRKVPDCTTHFPWSREGLIPTPIPELPEVRYETCEECDRSRPGCDCGGAGRYEISVAIDVGHMRLASGYLRRLQAIGAECFLPPETPGTLPPVYFRAGNIEALLMPIRKPISEEVR